MANKAVFLMGPTAVGKTGVALQLAKYFPIEVISVDSALIYRGLDIGSAKPTVTELQAVPHHLINILSPVESYSVAEFLQDCNLAINDICSRNRLPVLVGGTMMYYNALMHGISKLPEASPQLREKLERDFISFGNQAMHERLAKLDPVNAAKIAVNDRQRIERALEVCILTGKPMSLVQADNRLPGLVNCDYLPLAILPGNRPLLHERINFRFQQMVEHGVIAEVVRLRTDYPNLTVTHNSMRTVGYSQIWQYLDGNTTYDEMLELGMAATRQLAKRQITWLRGMKCSVLDDPKLDSDNLLRGVIDSIHTWLSVT